MPDENDDKKDNQDEIKENTSFTTESDSTEQRDGDSPSQGRRDIGGFVPTS